MLEVC